MTGGDSYRPFVTVVLPVRNEEAHLEPCLQSILAQDYPADRMEILIADGRSEDGTRSLVGVHAERDPRIRLVDNPGKIVPTGLNAAIREARGEVIVRVDGHTTIEADYVSESVSALERTGADVVGGKMHAVGRGPFGRTVAMATSTPMGVGGSRFHYADREEPAESVYMGVFRRDLFRRFGWFNERMVRNQDDEFNYRVRKGGGTVFLVPQLRSTYSPRESPRALFRQYFQYGLYKVRVGLLHPRMIRPRHLIPSAFTLLLVALLLLTAGLPGAWPAPVLLLLAHMGASLLLSIGPGLRDPGSWLLVPAATLILHLAYGAGVIGGGLAALMGRPPGGRESRAPGDVS